MTTGSALAPLLSSPSRAKQRMALASYPCSGSEISGCVHSPGLPLLGLGPSVVCCSSSWLPGRLDDLPAGITVEGAPPPQGECLSCATVCAGEHSPVPHQRPKRGGRSLHHHPSRAARRARRGHAGLSPATFVAEDAGNLFQPASNTAFQVKPPPQRRGLRPLRVERWGC